MCLPQSLWYIPLFEISSLNTGSCNCSSLTSVIGRLRPNPGGDLQVMSWWLTLSTTRHGLLPIMIDRILGLKRSPWILITVPPAAGPFEGWILDMTGSRDSPVCSQTVQFEDSYQSITFGLCELSRQYIPFANDSNFKASYLLSQACTYGWKSEEEEKKNQCTNESNSLITFVPDFSTLPIM